LLSRKQRPHNVEDGGSSAKAAEQAFRVAAATNVKVCSLVSLRRSVDGEVRYARIKMRRWEVLDRSAVVDTIEAKFARRSKVQLAAVF
jgi:hypothetical protein